MVRKTDINGKLVAVCMVGSGDNCFYSRRHDQELSLGNSARTRRGQVRLCRPSHIARHAALRASGAAISKLTQIHYDYWTDYSSATFGNHWRLKNYILIYKRKL